MIFIYSLIIVLILNLIGFLVAFSIKSDKLTDLMYGASFLTIAIYAYISNSKSLSTTLLLMMVGFWAIRLAGFLFIRIFKIKRDKRFDGIREDFAKFGMFWLFQAITAWVVMIPSLFFFQSPLNMNWLMLVGVIIWSGGFVIESMADYQKFKFKSDPNNKDKWISSGLWSHSRHPNYLGEILMWVGLYIFVFSALSLNAKFISLISPVLITVLLLFVTGIPKLEKYADNKWGKQAAYKDYKQTVPILIPKI